MAEKFLQSVWCAVPVYNNPETVADVVRRCCEQVAHVVVIDDGSDRPVEDLPAGLPVTVLRHETNRGKGAALLTALRYIHVHDGAWMIALDADGQHNPEDIQKFLPVMQTQPEAIHIGARDFDVPNVPESSRFGRSFSNFWVRLETGKNLPDTQSGFRAYPVDLVSQLPLHGSRYDFEIEVLVRAAWAGLALNTVAISVWYPPENERVTSFDKRKDNLCLTRMHARLVGRRLVPWPAKRLVKRDFFTLWELLKNPRRCIRLLLHENATPVGLAVSGGVGVLLGTLPLIALHSVAILYVTARLNLNKVMALSIQNLCAPPVVPILCIEVGHLICRGSFFVPNDPQSVFADLHEHLFHWLIGSLVLAPLLALLAAWAVYRIAVRVQKGPAA